MSDAYLPIWACLLVLLAGILIHRRFGLARWLEGKAAAEKAAGLLVVRRGTFGIFFCAVWIVVLSLMGSSIGGVAGCTMLLACAIGVVGIGIASRHKIILSTDRLTVLAWRRCDISRNDITSWHAEYDTENVQIMWIDVLAGHKTVRLGGDLMNSRADAERVLAQLAKRDH